MGATYDEVVADYMLSFRNYYGVTEDDARYGVIAGGNIVKSLSAAFGVADLRRADLAACAEAYFRSIGLDDAELGALRRNLSGVPAAAAEPPAPRAALSEILRELFRRNAA